MVDFIIFMFIGLGKIDIFPIFSEGGMYEVRNIRIRKYCREDGPYGR